MSAALAMSDDPRTLGDVVNAKAVAAEIRESAEHVLGVSLAREGIAATPEQIKRLAREIGNNASTPVCFMEITK